MNAITQEHIELYIDAIEQNNFNELYQAITSAGADVQDLTNTLLAVEIDPLEYMSYVPRKYLYKSTESVKRLKIPGNIKTIFDHAFYMTDLSEIELPEGVTTLYSKSFAMCKDLMFVTLPSTIEFIDRAVFAGSCNLMEIRYNGTLEEWDEIDKYDAWLSTTRQITVRLICMDGERWIH